MKGVATRMVRVVALVLFLCGAGMQARAEDSPSPEALAAAQDLMAVISPDMMKQLTSSIAATFWPVVEQKARAEKIDDATIGALRTEFERGISPSPSCANWRTSTARRPAPRRCGKFHK